MDPPELRRYLRLVGTHLRDLGLLERGKVLREVRTDVFELATKGSHSTPTRSEVSQAIERMPDPTDVAETYLRRYTPSLILARASYGVNLVLGIFSLILGAQILSTRVMVWQGWPVNLLITLASLVLLMAGAAAVAIYGIALPSPFRARPWRFVAVPATVVCFTADGIQAMAAAAAQGLSWPLAMSAFLATFLGGAYTTSYSHHQLARAESRTHFAEQADDYFLEVERHLAPLDTVRREGILRELRDHLASRNISSGEGVNTQERFAATQEVLGSPAEVASSYLREMQNDSGRRLRLPLKIGLVIAGLGIAIGVPILGVGLQTAVFNNAYLTPLGLLGSVGLLGASLATVAVGMHLFRMPFKAPDYDLPLGTLMVTCALLISATAIAVPAGALLQPATTIIYDVKASLPRDDGGLAVFWAAYSAEYTSFITFPLAGATGPTLGAWVTELNPEGDITATVEFPWTLPASPVLDLGVDNGTWAALFADSLYTWGKRSDSMEFSPPPWQEVDGWIDGSYAQIAWVNYSEEQSLLNVQFTRIDVANLVADAGWSQSLASSGVYKFYVSVGPRSVLVAAVLHETQEGYQRSAVSVYLLDEFGTPSLSAILQEQNVTSTGLEDRGNGTWMQLKDLYAVGSGFWLMGTARATVNGTSHEHTWAAWIDETGAYAEWSVHEVESPSPSAPVGPGDLVVLRAEESIPHEGGLLVVTSTTWGVFDGSGDVQLDPETSKLQVSRLQADGAIDSTASLASPNLTTLLQVPFLSTWDGTTTLFVLPFEQYDPDGRIPLYSYPLGNLSAEEDPRSIPLTMGEAALFYRLLVRGWGLGFGSGPTQTAFVGEAYVEEPGFLDWRKNVGNPALGYVQVPAVLQVDHTVAKVQLIPLTTPLTPPDTFMGLLITTIFTMAGVLTLAVGYPRWRLFRERKRRE